MSFLRFVAFERRRRFSTTLGPFSLAYALADDGEQPIYYRRPLRVHLDWFDAYLPVPDRSIHQDDLQIVALDHKRPAHECW